MSFELDQRMVGDDSTEIRGQRHVFISGLARAGTTILMRRFYETGLYTSLTYSDMPFVLAPNLWRRITSISNRESEEAERAHNDGVLVNTNSPESLDEVYWRVFAGGEYIHKNYLSPHEPSKELIDQFVYYVNAILAKNSPRKNRYLSKNNNNILRLGAIHRAFPDALILIPFRDPLQHAASLLRQHVSFSKKQEESGFTLCYMTWLSHHEFGLDHRPFLVGDFPVSKYPIHNVNYWLDIWCNTYSWLSKMKPESALFVCYETICTNPNYWQGLARLADISVLSGTGASFKLSKTPIDLDVDQVLLKKANDIYKLLAVQTSAALS